MTPSSTGWASCRSLAVDAQVCKGDARTVDGVLGAALGVRPEAPKSRPASGISSTPIFVSSGANCLAKAANGWAAMGDAGFPLDESWFLLDRGRWRGVGGFVDGGVGFSTRFGVNSDQCPGFVGDLRGALPRRGCGTSEAVGGRHALDQARISGRWRHVQHARDHLRCPQRLPREGLEFLIRVQPFYNIDGFARQRLCPSSSSIHFSKLFSVCGDAGTFPWESVAEVLALP